METASLLGKPTRYATDGHDDDLIHEDYHDRDDYDRPDRAEHRGVDEHAERNEEYGHERVTQWGDLSLQPFYDPGLGEGHPDEERTYQRGHPAVFGYGRGQGDDPEHEKNEHLIALHLVQTFYDIGDDDRGHDREEHEEGDHTDDHARRGE